MYNVEHIKVKPDEIVVLRYNTSQLSPDDVYATFCELDRMKRSNNEFPSNLIALPDGLSLESMSRESIEKIISQLYDYLETIE